MASLEDRISKASLEDRISKPGTVEDPQKPSVDTTTAPVNDNSKIESWADEMATPVQSDAREQKNDLPKAQVDGSSEAQNGSAGTFEPTYDVEVKLSDVQADPNNPLYSTTSFEDEQLGLSEGILKGVRQMRFLKPSKIQEKALPLLLRNPPQNLIGQSQSGTGKTAAFVLNILKRLDLPTQAPQALVLSPTRELTRQIQGVIQVMGSFMEGLKVTAAIPMDAANRGQKVDAQVVVGTPGTTMDMIRRRLIDISNIKVVVLDEADNMLDQQGLGDQCIRIKKMLRPGVQIVLFSATFEDRVVDYATMFAPNANQITLKHEELTVEGIKQMYIDTANDDVKFDTLVRLYGVMTIGSSIIFVKTRETARKLTERLSNDGHQVAALTGEYEGSQRDVIIDAFRTGQAKVLITTNVLARGIDVQTVSLVINYDIPQDANRQPDPATYLHRIGRTGRFGRVGVSISLVSPGRPWKDLQYIANYFRIQLIQLDTSDWDDVEDQIKKVLKSSRAGANFKGNSNTDMAG